MTSPPRFKDALEVFARHRVDLIVVGGVAAVIGGAPLATFDLDVVHARNVRPASQAQATIFSRHAADPSTFSAPLDADVPTKTSFLDLPPSTLMA